MIHAVVHAGPGADGKTGQSRRYEARGDERTGHGQVSVSAFAPSAGLGLALDADLPSGASVYVLLAGIALVALSLLMRLRKRRQRQGLEPTAQEKVERMRQLRGMRGDLEDLMVEIEALARRFSAQLDAKSLQLEKLIEEADRRIERLAGAAGPQERPRGLGDPQTPPPSPEAIAPDDALARAIHDLADQGVAAADIASRLGEHIGKVELILALRDA